jgi:hypothetical protein
MCFGDFFAVAKEREIALRRTAVVIAAVRRILNVATDRETDRERGRE